jgi:hypothetical protein
MAVAGIDSRFAILDHNLRAVSIVFDLVNPMLALGRLIDRGRELRLDESKPGMLT